MSKDCQGCPDQPTLKDLSPNAQESTPFRHQNAWIVYAGGTFGNQLRLLERSLPEGYDRVRFEKDGSIRYEKRLGDWEPPSPIEGYERDPEDECLFRPLWKSCQLRMLSTVVKESCQCIQVVAKCANAEADVELFSSVDHETCLNCQHRMPV